MVLQIIRNAGQLNVVSSAGLFLLYFYDYLSTAFLGFVLFLFLLLLLLLFFSSNLLRAAGEIRALSTLLQLCSYRIFYLLTGKKNVMIIAFFSVAPSQNRTSECPLHYNMIGDDCYFVSSIKLTWKEAREVCKGESNGDLISVHSPVEEGKIMTVQTNLNVNFSSYTVKGLRFGGRKTILHGTRTRVI